MKKSMLWTGLTYVVAGTILLAVSWSCETRVESLLFGFGFACLAPGLVAIGRYFYWSTPKNRDRYRERIERETIELHDELNVKLRDKSGRYAYLAGLAVLSLSIVVFSLLDAWEVIAGGRLMVLYLGGYFLFQILIGLVFFRRLKRKYLAG